MSLMAKSLYPWLLILFLAAGIGVLRLQMHEQDKLFASLREEKQELENLRQVNESLQRLDVSTNELLQLRAQNLTLPQLRREITRRHDQELQPLTVSASVQATPEYHENQQLRLENDRLHNQQLQAACVNNLQQIDAAKQQRVAENKLEDGVILMLNDLAGSFPGGAIPVCPAGGHYSINRVGSPPSCSINGHSIP
ncbi:MAG: hypothetical protein JWR26_97 [Pedosphaera sp.]|nr:hypothetical protein [Pedosphaera sp.]